MVVDNLLWRPYFLVSQGGFEVFAIRRSCVSLSTHHENWILWNDDRPSLGELWNFFWVTPFFGCARNLHWWVLMIRRVSKWRPWVTWFGSLCWIAMRLNHLYLLFLLKILTSKQLSSAICMTVTSENAWIACNLLEPHFGSKVWERNFAHKPQWEPSTIAAPKLKLCFQWWRPSSTPPITAMISKRHSQGWDPLWKTTIRTPPLSQIVCLAEQCHSFFRCSLTLESKGSYLVSKSLR